MLITTFFLFLLSTLNALALPVETPKNSTNKEYLLPDNKIIPSHYDVTIDVSQSFENIALRTFSGEVKITATVKEDADKIVLHAADILVQNEKIPVSVDGPIKQATYEFDHDKQFLIINLAVKKYSKISIDIPYNGILQDNMHGFYVSEYDGGTVLTTQFEPTHARKAFPCFDEPKYKATFAITFKKPEGYEVLSNMPPNKKDHINDTEVYFPVTPKMSTYLVAFIVHKFESKSAPTDDRFKIWSRPSANSQTEEAADNVVQIVENLSEFTGINYTDHIPKMDMAALPDFSAGAMENWGLLTYRETALLVDPKLSTNRDIQRVVSVIAHEVAHQWFGDLVTLTWWDNTWLNEGFASYFEYHTTGNVKPDWEMKDQFVVEEQQAVFGVDALEETTPLTRPVYTPTEISSHFGSISYNKGGSVIRMLEHFIGSDLFRKGLQTYLARNKYTNTMPIDLWTALEDTISQSESFSLDTTISKIMTSWISQPGYPVVNVKVETDGTTTFSQQRFYINPSGTKKASNELWFVPISYTTSKDMNFADTKPKLWLQPHEPVKTVILGDLNHLIVNVQQAGYYRVNYNKYMWEKIAAALKTDERNKIHHLNKAQLIDDSLNLARAGLLDYKIAFSISDYLENETGYFPWYSAFQAFRYLMQRYSEDETTGKELRSYLKGLMEKLVSDKTFEEKEDENQISVFNRVSSLEWACSLGHETCIAQAKDIFKKHRETGVEIPKNLRSTVYCTALRNGDTSDWDFLWTKYLNSNVAAEKIGIINALGCSNDDAILIAYLLKSINDKNIRKQDAYNVFSSVYTGNMKGVDIAFQFLQDHHNDIKTKYNGINDLEKAVLGLGGRLTDSEKIKKFEEYLDSNEDFKNFREAAKETIKQNIAWADKYSKAIGDILQKKRTEESGEPGSAVSIIVNKFVLSLSLCLVYIYLL